MLLIFLSLTTFISTLLGGLFALKFRGYIQHMLAFTAGVLGGLIFLHLFPEIQEIAEAGGYGLTAPIAAFALGYVGFQVFHKVLHRHHDHDHGHDHAKRPVVGVVSALALASHSFLDGVAIGLAFQVNAQIGVAVAVAVIAHDFADGLNAVSVMLAYKNSIRRAAMLLALVALAPVAGVISTLFIQIPEVLLLWYLGGFAGFIIYLLGKDILPHAFEGQRKRVWVPLSLMLFGLIFVYIATGFTHGLE